MLVVEEETSNWGHLIRCSYGTRYDIRIANASSLSSLPLEKFHLIFVQFSQPCVDSWVSLFDKKGFRSENLGTALLNAPQDKAMRSWCQELGFQNFIDDVRALNDLMGKWNDKLPVLPGFGILRDEMISRIPWSESNE